MSAVLHPRDLNPENLEKLSPEERAELEGEPRDTVSPRVDEVTWASTGAMDWTPNATIPTPEPLTPENIEDTFRVASETLNRMEVPDLAVPVERGSLLDRMARHNSDLEDLPDEVDVELTGRAQRDNLIDTFFDSMRVRIEPDFPFTNFTVDISQEEDRLGYNVRAWWTQEGGQERAISIYINEPDEYIVNCLKNKLLGKFQD